MRRARRGDRAAALLLALTALVILGALGAALGAAVLRGMAVAREAEARDRLLNVAESGLDLAMSRLARDPSWSGGEGVPVPGGECTVTVRRAAGGVLDVTSRAVAEPRPGRRTRVRVELRAEPAGRFRIVAWERQK